tara:strand:- start:435 stop:737 length:303 start_codon:yes stop_codon:yes gene_type:complete
LAGFLPPSKIKDMEDKKSNITIRLPESALKIFRDRAAKSGEAVSKVVADACVSVIETPKLMDEQQAMPMELAEGETPPPEKTYLADPFAYKPFTFVDSDS